MSDVSTTHPCARASGPVLAAATGARRVVDATLGDGGHAAALIGTGAVMLGIDRDPAAIEVSRRASAKPACATSRQPTLTPTRWRR